MSGKIIGSGTPFTVLIRKSGIPVHTHIACWLGKVIKATGFIAYSPLFQSLHEQNHDQ